MHRMRQGQVTIIGQSAQAKGYMGNNYFEIN